MGRGVLFQAHSSCWQNSVPCSRMTKVPVFLRGATQFLRPLAVSCHTAVHNRAIRFFFQASGCTVLWLPVSSSLLQEYLTKHKTLMFYTIRGVTIPVFPHPQLHFFSFLFSISTPLDFSVPQRMILLVYLPILNGCDLTSFQLGGKLKKKGNKFSCIGGNNVNVLWKTVVPHKIKLNYHMIQQLHFWIHTQRDLVTLLLWEAAPGLEITGGVQ